MGNLAQILHFCYKRGGRQALYEMIDRLNRGISKSEVASAFNMDKGQFSRFLKANIHTRYILDDDIIEALAKLNEIEKIRILCLPAPKEASQKKTG